MTRRTLLYFLAAAPAALPADSGKGLKAPGVGRSPAVDGDAILFAMKQELSRSRQLGLGDLGKPYFIEYTVEDVDSYSVSASLGALFTPNESSFRVPRVRLRVGGYDFDNSNYVYSDYYSGTRYDPQRLPLDDDVNALRRAFWLATDRAYKTAVEAIARKRAALRNVTQNETLPDLWKSEPVEKIEARHVAPDNREWPARARRISSVFLENPEVLFSNVEYQSSRSTFYLHNSEGTAVRTAHGISAVQIRASAHARDGSTVRDAAIVARLNNAALPSETELEQLARNVAGNVKALAEALAGESYVGPVLVEGIAAPQMIAELLGPNLALPRRPVAEPGRPTPFAGSELEGRIGSRVLPDFLGVVDDPTQKMWQETPLFGHYDIDEEGVIPGPLTLIEKGRLKAFLLTRQPVKGFDASNGRARVPAAYGANRAAYGNLFVRATESVSARELRDQFLQMVRDRGKPYGIVVRKMDFPTTASASELRRMMAGAEPGGHSRLVSPPILVYRVSPDGKEELLRGIRFRGLSVRSLKDIIAASDESQAFHFMNSLAPLGLSGGGYIAPVSVIAPNLLFDELELERPPDDVPTPPDVPPPSLSVSR